MNPNYLTRMIRSALAGDDGSRYLAHSAFVALMQWQYSGILPERSNG